jgi:hypothetical protein
MKLEQQVCSLQLAQELKELGVKQESAFQWLQYPHTRKGLPNEWEVTYGNQPEGNTLWVSAFSVAELGEMLAQYPQHSFGTGYNKSRRSWGGSLFINEQEDRYEDVTFHWSDTEADARAKMLIYLLENNLLTA